MQALGYINEVDWNDHEIYPQLRIRCGMWEDVIVALLILVLLKAIISETVLLAVLLLCLDASSYPLA